MGFPDGSAGKESATRDKMWVRSLGWEDPLEKEMAIHSSILAWRIPWTEEPGGLQSTGSQRIGHDWAIKHVLYFIWTLFCPQTIKIAIRFNNFVKWHFIVTLWLKVCNFYLIDLLNCNKMCLFTTNVRGIFKLMDVYMHLSIYPPTIHSLNNTNEWLLWA